MVKKTQLLPLVNVVLSGSGTRYPMHVGALEAITQRFRINAIAGVSGGAIVAGLYASSLDIEHTRDVVLSTLPGPAKLIDERCIFSFLRSRGKRGLIKGNKLLSSFENEMVHTFEDTQIPLSVYATDIYTRSEKIWDSVNTPEYSIARAVRASMSYPFVFDPVVEGKHFYWDGGLLNNLPADAFKGSEYPTIAIYISSQTQFKEVRSWKDSITFLIDTVLEGFVKEDIEDMDGVVIEVPSKGKVFNFKMKANDARILMEHGYNNVARDLTYIT